MSGRPGVDYAWSKPAISALKAAGEVFAAQYFSNDSTKNLTPARAHELQAAGIEVVVVWEFTATAMRGGKTQGQRDASDAQVQAKACGVDGIPIYFACDYDAPPGDQDAINAYLDGAASIIGHARTGMYGGYWPLSRAHAAGKTSYLWGTPAWSGNNWATQGLVPDIMQGGMVTIGGVQCDLDAALHNDFGQWPRPKGLAKTWQVWETKGKSTLQQVSQAVGMDPASILRYTVQKFGPFDSPLADWLNDLAYGRIDHTRPIYSGARLWVLR